MHLKYVKYATLGFAVVALMMPLNSAMTTEPAQKAVGVYRLAPLDQELAALKEVVTSTEQGCHCSEGGWWWGSSCDKAEDACPSGSGAACYVADGTCVCVCTKPQFLELKLEN